MRDRLPFILTAVTGAAVGLALGFSLGEWLEDSINHALQRSWR
jgi:membrane protein DedA with SNARE-associated domain